MRELNQSEIDQVSGGGLPLVILGGAAVSGFGSYLAGDSPGQIAASAALGGLTGASLSFAKITGGLLSWKFRAQGAGLSTANALTASGQGESDVGDTEKVLEK